MMGIGFSTSRLIRGLVIVLGLGIEAYSGSALAESVYLDADTLATGSQLGTEPLVTPLGTIVFSGTMDNVRTDAEFDAAGAMGNAFDVGDNSTAKLSFDFDVRSITFIYGGNLGQFNAEARDFDGGVVDTFFQADTYEGQPAGPITLSGAGIRSLFWFDPDNTFAAIDNVTITEQVPEPGAGALTALALFVAIGSARRRRWW